MEKLQMEGKNQFKEERDNFVILRTKQGPKQGKMKNSK